MKICPNCKSQNHDNAQACFCCGFPFYQYPANNNPQQPPNTNNPQYNPQNPYLQSHYPQQQNYSIPQYVNSHNISNPQPLVINTLEKERKTNWKTITLIALLVLLLIVGGYLIYAVVHRYSENTRKAKEQKEELIRRANIQFTINDLLKEGNYEDAYRTAESAYDKDEVKNENIIAYISSQEMQKFFDPGSFTLIDAWYNEDYWIVLYESGLNRAGETTDCYSLWFVDPDNKKNWKFLPNKLEPDNVEASLYNDETVKSIQKVNKRVDINSYASESDKVYSTTIDNINYLHQQGKLDEVLLLNY